MPNNPKGGGISRRIEGEQRAELRQAMSQLTIPTEHALIARTAGIGKSPEELQWDLDFLLQLWEAIRRASEDRPAPFLVYQETNLVVRAIRDYLRSDIAEIMIDDKQIYERASKFMEQVMLLKIKEKATASASSRSKRRPPRVRACTVRAWRLLALPLLEMANW